MQPISNILLATDFSKGADRATELAIQMAQKFSAKLTILYVYFAPLYLGPIEDAYLMQPELGEKLRGDAVRAIELLRQRVTDAGVAVEGLAMEGIVADMIVEVAASRRMDLVIMGTHGRTGLSHLLLGSVAERVVRMAQCPVMTARAPSSP